MATTHPRRHRPGAHRGTHAARRAGGTGHPGSREPRGDAQGAQAHTRRGTCPGRRASPAPRPRPEARREHDRDRRLRHGRPGEILGPQRAAGTRGLPGGIDARDDRRQGAQRWEQPTPDGQGMEGARLVLVDTPGIDEVGGEAREALARDVARHADLILFVVSSDMQRRELEALSLLREAQKPILLVFNQIDRYPDADRDLIYDKIKDERIRDLVRPDDVVMTAARPDAVKVKTRHPDGTTSVGWEHPAPIIEPLKARILAVLEREGKALVALNTLLLAGDLHEEIVAHKVRIRDDAANRLIWNFALAKGAAVALNPIPIADMAGGLAVDVGMIIALSKVYGIPLTRRTASSLIKDMMMALGALGAVEVVTRLLASGVKSSLAGLSILSGGLAIPLTALGYGAIGLARGGTAATTSYVLGQGAKFYLRQGCQWGPRGIKTVIHQILEQAKNDTVIDRLREDLKRRMSP
ncbi:MAG: DUF697 domain-containing protein [Singulisphaera sp.]